MIRLTLVSLVIAAALPLAAAARPTAAHPTLFGTVGKNDAYKIALQNTVGKVVKTLPHGTYKLVIHDTSTIHDYELDGPQGKSWSFTSVPFKGTKTFTLNLTPGAYKAYCGPHEVIMFQHFKVT